VTWRVSVSVAPPGGNATTSRIGRSGYEEGLCACAEAAAPSNAHTKKQQRKRLRTARPPPSIRLTAGPVALDHARSAASNARAATGGSPRCAREKRRAARF